MMMIALFNNLPEIVLAVCWTIVVFRGGMHFERWRNSRRNINGAAKRRT